METNQLRNCSNPECDALNTGICVEGNSPVESCPFFGLAVEDVNNDDTENLTAPEALDVQLAQESSQVTLPSGETLTPAEVDRFLLCKSVRFITIIGDLDSGKTTLICALYDKFLRGSFAGYLFAGSRTLVGLEKNSHHARIDSGREAPDTQRTSISDGLKFFHFSLVPSDSSQSRIELMLSDRAGEQYKKARDNSDVASELIEVKKAQHVVLLMNGEHISEHSRRHNAMQSVRQTIRAYLDAGAFSKNSLVQVVMTKIDLLENIPDKQLIEDQLEQFYSTLQKDFSGRLGDLSFSEISARDPKGIFPPAKGINELLKKWCTSAPQPPIQAQLQIRLNTEFDRLLSRTPMEDFV